MLKACLVFLVLLGWGGLSRAQTTELQSDPQQLLSQLQDAKTSEQAATRLRALAKEDTTVQKYVSEHLPKVIERHSVGLVWLNAVRLAGDLKIVSAVDVLVAALSQDNRQGVLSFAEEQRLDDDPPGKALVEIGDPAIPELARVLQSGGRNVRWRATLVLVNNNSPRARQVLREHLESESDPDLKAVMQKAVE
jgi:hypothetical protein